MASYYLAPFVGSGTEVDPFRPDVEAASWSIIDLRADNTQQAGWCVVRAEGVTATGADVEYLGESTDLGSELRPPIRNRLKNNLGVDIQQLTLDAILAELLIVWGEDGPGRTRWRPLKANHLGRHRIVMGGEVIYDAPAIQGVTITESFNKADSTTLGPDLTWTEVAGDAQVISNQVGPVATNTVSRARAESDLASSDMYVQFDVPTLAPDGTGAGNLVRPCARYQSGADTTYAFNIQSTSTAGDFIFRLIKYVTGTYTEISSVLGSATLPFVGRLEVDGSGLDGLIDGVSKLSTTDTSIATGTRSGIIVYSASDTTGTRIDNFEAGDLGAGGDATVTPAAIAVTAALPAATPSGDANVSPATTPAVAALPAASVTVDDTVAPAAIASTAALPAVSVSGDAQTSPSTIPVVAALPAASSVTAGNATVTPATIEALTSVLAAAVSGDAQASPSTIALIVALPAATVQAGGNVTVTPATVEAIAALPAASLSAGATVAPGVIATTAALLAPTVIAGSDVTVTPAAIAGTVSVPAVSITVDATVTPDTIAASFAVLVATIEGVLVAITARSISRFYRSPLGDLVLAPMGRSQIRGFKTGEGFEVVSAIVVHNTGDEETLQQLVSSAWATHSGSDQATLTTAINEALQSAGYRGIGSADLT